MNPYKENQSSIHDWGLKTFGPNTPQATAARMNVEVAELLNGLQNLAETPRQNTRDRQKLALECVSECADVYIMLAQIAAELGADLAAAVDQKMEINRARKWGRGKNGKMQHVEIDCPNSDADEREECLRSDRPWVIDCPADGCDSPTWPATWPNEFHEFVSGLRMERGKFYVLSEEGEALSPRGFASPQAAIYWANSREGVEAGAQQARPPVFRGPKLGWIQLHPVNIFAANDLEAFWKEQMGT